MIDFRKQTVLITGGAGFVGTNLADRFASDGARVLVYDDLSRKGVERNLEWLKAEHGDRVEVVVEDVRNAAAVRAAVARADAVLHLAAQVAVTTSVEDPEEDFEVNARGTLNVLEAARARDVPPPVIFTSTNKVYGNLGDVPLEEGELRYEPADADLRDGIGETRPLDFHSPYGCSKGSADQYVLDYARSYGVPGAVLRMSCIYGPHQHGTEDQGWVAHFLIRALRGDPIRIYGDGKQVRDILFVEDLVDVFRRVLRNMERLSGEVFNVGGGRENSTSLLEILARMEALEGTSVDVSFGPWRRGDQRWYVSDTSRLQECTGWRPRTSLHEGLERLHEWLRSNQAAPADRRRRAAVV